MFSETWSLASAAQQFKQGVLILSVIDMWGHIPLCFWGLYWVLHVYQHSWSLHARCQWQPLAPIITTKKSNY